MNPTRAGRSPAITVCVLCEDIREEIACRGYIQASEAHEFAPWLDALSEEGRLDFAMGEGILGFEYFGSYEEFEKIRVALDELAAEGAIVGYRAEHLTERPSYVVTAVLVGAEVGVDAQGEIDRLAGQAKMLGWMTKVRVTTAKEADRCRPAVIIRGTGSRDDVDDFVSRLKTL
jgi:hypothetical protein